MLELDGSLDDLDEPFGAFALLELPEPELPDELVDEPLPLPDPL
jgi:hypothetical protein